MELLSRVHIWNACSGITTPKLYEMTFVGNSILNGGTFGPEGGLIVTMVIILMLVSLVFLIGIRIT